LKLPRDLSGTDLAKKLGKYGYRVSHQTGSHIRLTSEFKGIEHHITIPAHDALKTGTLGGIISEIAAYLKVDRRTIINRLFKP
jgi:predicted RNA binding protein YcfA (HicA-like mRNA interferase family)